MTTDDEDFTRKQAEHKEHRYWAEAEVMRLLSDYEVSFSGWKIAELRIAFFVEGEQRFVTCTANTLRTDESQSWADSPSKRLNGSLSDVLQELIDKLNWPLGEGVVIPGRDADGGIISVRLPIDLSMRTQADEQDVAIK